MPRTYEEVLKDVSAMIAEQLHKQIDEVKPDSTLESLGADSLDRVELIMKMEEHFHIEINDDEAEKLHTVDDAVKYIQSLIK